MVICAAKYVNTTPSLLALKSLITYEVYFLFPFENNWNNQSVEVQQYILFPSTESRNREDFDFFFFAWKFLCGTDVTDCLWPRKNENANNGCEACIFKTCTSSCIFVTMMAHYFLGGQHPCVYFQDNFILHLTHIKNRFNKLSEMWTFYKSRYYASFFSPSIIFQPPMPLK